MLPAALLAMLLAGAAGAAGDAGAQEPAPACPFAGRTATLLLRLYFGQSVRAGGVVSRRAWQRFVAERVTSALPDGFTVNDATGQFRNPASGAIGREATEIVEVAAADTPGLRARIAPTSASSTRAR